MKSLSTLLKDGREQKGMVIRQLAAASGIDAALISKFEKGKRLPTEENLTVLSQTLHLPLEELKKLWLVEKVVEVIQYRTDARAILEVAESRVEYLRSNQVFDLPALSEALKSKLDYIDQLKNQWQSARPLNQTQLKKMQEFFHVAYTYESNRIEGNTLSLQETHLVVNEGITIGGKSLREHLEAVNHSEAIGFMESLVRADESYSRKLLLELHYLILKGIDKENAGRFRSVPVRISGSRHEPPQPYLLEKMMEDYFIHFQRQKHQLHPVILAAEMHERLVSIHPFIDGNGRTSRLVMNLILLQNGYTIANLKGDLDSRIKYYNALEKVQVDSDPQPFYDLVCNEVIESLQKHLELT